MPEFTEVMREEMVTVTAAVAGADAVVEEWRRRPLSFRPSRISVRYSRVDGGPWVAHTVNVSGPRLFQNGREGSIHSQWYWPVRPDWVAAFVADNTP